MGFRLEENKWTHGVRETYRCFLLKEDMTVELKCHVFLYVSKGNILKEKKKGISKGRVGYGFWVCSSRNIMMSWYSDLMTKSLNVGTVIKCTLEDILRQVVLLFNE